MTDDAAFETWLHGTAEQVETRLSALLVPTQQTPARRLAAAMGYATLGGGKRLRPFLLIETARTCGADPGAALDAACALEMVHCYSLVHDDLPAMDNDDLRRGRPTVHRAFNEATAILAGDGLLTEAFAVLAGLQAPPATVVALVRGLAEAAGPAGMVGGQALDLEAERAWAPLGEDEVRRIQTLKTGALLRYAVEAGAVLGGATEADKTALVAYGQAIGAAFQVADDILDHEGDTATLGKKANKDAARNKPTLVAALGLEEARARRDALVDTALAALARTNLDTARLAAAARFTAARKS